MALPRRSAGGHHILLWIVVALGAVIGAVVLILVGRELFQSWFP